MPKLPWNTIDADIAPENLVMVMASEFKLRSHQHVPGFFRDSMKIRAQVLKAEGAVGVSLDAQLFAKTFRTLSAWHNRKALDAVMKAEPHRSAMKRHRPNMLDSTFVYWEVLAHDLPVQWEEAEQRLAA